MTPVGPAQQPDIVVGSNGTFPVPILGQITLTFTPDAVIPSDDPAVQFSSGGRRVNFTIPANSTQADFGVPAVAVQTGTVAGTITLTVTLQAGGRDVTPTPPPTRIIRIERSAPVITGMRVNRITSGFEVLLSGYSTPRQITQATFRLTPAAGSNLQTTELTLDVSGLFTRWYQDPASSQFGGLFTFAQSFTIQGDLNAISSVSVTLTNAQGTSQPALAGF